MQEEPCPIPHRERTDKLEDAGEDKQPAEELHRGHRGCDGPNNCGDTEQKQHHAKRQEPSPVMNHLLGDLEYQHFIHFQLSFLEFQAAARSSLMM
jgi:hypothetical protein